MSAINSSFARDIFRNLLLTEVAENSSEVLHFRPERAQVVFDRLRPYLPTAFIALVLTYVCVQYLTGDKGFFSQEAREAEMKAKTEQLAQLKTERSDLEARAKYLRTDNLSKDLLEERARVLLGLFEPKAYIIRDRITDNANS